MHRRSFIGLAGSLAIAGPATARTLEIRQGDSGRFYTTATVERRTIDVLIDTGASFTVLTHEDAERVGVAMGRLVFDVQVSTINGVANNARIQLNEVRVGHIVVDNVPALATPRGALNISLIGMTFLSRIRSYRIRDRVLILDD
jgi:aspartyl protease family protein